MLEHRMAVFDSLEHIWMNDKRLLNCVEPFGDGFTGFKRENLFYDRGKYGLAWRYMMGFSFTGLG